MVKRKSVSLLFCHITCCRAGQATENNMAHGHFMLDTKGYKHTLIICNTHCYSTSTLATWTRLNITFHAHCLSCSYELYQSTLDALSCNIFGCWVGKAGMWCNLIEWMGLLKTSIVSHVTCTFGFKYRCCEFAHISWLSICIVSVQPPSN